MVGENISMLGRALVPRTLAHNASIVVIRLVCMSMLRKACVCEICGIVNVRLFVCKVMVGGIAGVAVAARTMLICLNGDSAPS